MAAALAVLPDRTINPIAAQIIALDTNIGLAPIAISLCARLSNSRAISALSRCLVIVGLWCRPLLLSLGRALAGLSRPSLNGRLKGRTGFSNCFAVTFAFQSVQGWQDPGAKTRLEDSWVRTRTLPANLQSSPFQSRRLL